MKIIKKAKTVEQRIIFKIKQFITSNNLKLGDRLPAERDLADQFEVSRNQLRMAMLKLEFYGAVKKYPRSGTRISNMELLALDGTMSDLILLQRQDFKSLLETRIMTEINLVRFAAIRRTVADVYNIQNALEVFSEKASKGQNALIEDLIFHHKLAEAAGNPVLTSLLVAISPDIIHYFREYKVCNHWDKDVLIKEHQSITDAIIAKDVEMAMHSMEAHFAKLRHFSNEFRNTTKP